jgi:hypothetical protein
VLLYLERHYTTVNVTCLQAGLKTRLYERTGRV